MNRFSLKLPYSIKFYSFVVMYNLLIPFFLRFIFQAETNYYTAWQYLGYIIIGGWPIYSLIEILLGIKLLKETKSSMIWNKNKVYIIQLIIFWLMVLSFIFFLYQLKYVKFMD